jgi:hypothetical protein
MGGIVKSLFGGSSSKNQSQSTSESGNKFADQINTQFSPWAQQGMAQSSAGMGQAANVLGLNGADASSGALNDWWGSSGGKFLMNQGMDQIVGNRAAGGLLRSGGTSKAIEGYRSDLASTKLNEYLGNVLNLSQLGTQQGLGAGQLVTSAGQYSKGQSTSSGSGSESTGGLGKAIGFGLSLFSDRRLKADIVKLGEEPDGLGRYRYRYVWDETPREGVMADDVASLRPWALGPVIEGYRTVRYDLLEAA